MEVSVKLSFACAHPLPCFLYDNLVPSDLHTLSSYENIFCFAKGKPKEIWGRKATGQASNSTALASRPGYRSDKVETSVMSGRSHLS
jgi:hypothetical protein